MSLVSRIKDIAYKRKGWNLKETAQNAGLSINSIYKWDKQSPSLKALSAVANVLGVTVDELRGVEPKNEVTEDDLEKALDNAHSFNGEPMDDHDRQIIKGILKGYFKTKG